MRIWRWYGPGGRRRWWPVVVAGAAAVVVALIGPSLVRQWWVDDDAHVGEVTAGEARELLQRVPVKGRAPKTAYSRELYGRGWHTVAGCDMRNRILSRDLVDVVHRRGTRNCVVDSGTLHDPYTGATVSFQRGNATSALVQIDHRYPLALSWQQGAQQWSQAKREKFAADPANL